MKDISELVIICVILNIFICYFFQTEISQKISYKENDTNRCIVVLKELMQFHYC